MLKLVTAAYAAAAAAGLIQRLLECLGPPVTP